MNRGGEATVSDVVLLHGWGVRSTVFEALASALAERHRVRCLELAGYGGTDRQAPHTLAGLARDIALRAPKRCVVVGWSLGAQVALAWALSDPAQVARLVLISATPRFVRAPGWRHAVEPAVLAEVEEAVRLDPRAALLRFAALQVRGEVRARDLLHELRSRVCAAPVPSADVLLAGLRILMETDLRARLHEIAQPALVIHGGRDAVAPPAAGVALAQGIPRGRLAILKEAAHAPFLSQPQEVAGLIAEHLDG
jgi:pimeloyl-[acyl-carrier protein] methyl ester esterase